MNRPLVSLLLLLLPAAACTRSGGSPTCGIAMLAGPGLITSQLSNARAVLTDPPRGVPDSLPARGYGLLVVDDTSQRAMGVMVVDQEEPAGHPAIGTIIGGSTALNLYGVRVEWVSVNNPRCPLFGGPASQTS